MEGTEVNESPENARNVSLAQVLAMMTNRDHLIFCVILSTRNTVIHFNELRCQSEMVKLEKTSDDSSEEETDKITMAKCFKEYE